MPASIKRYSCCYKKGMPFSGLLSFTSTFYWSGFTVAPYIDIQLAWTRCSERNVYCEVQLLWLNEIHSYSLFSDSRQKQSRYNRLLSLKQGHAGVNNPSTCVMSHDKYCFGSHYSRVEKTTLVTKHTLGPKKAAKEREEEEKEEEFGQYTVNHIMGRVEGWAEDVEGMRDRVRRVASIMKCMVPFLKALKWHWPRQTWSPSDTGRAAAHWYSCQKHMPGCLSRSFLCHNDDIFRYKMQKSYNN